MVSRLLSSRLGARLGRQHELFPAGGGLGQFSADPAMLADHCPGPLVIDVQVRIVPLGRQLTLAAFQLGNPALDGR